MKGKNNFFYDLALVSQLGFTIVICILLAFLVGAFLDRKLNTGYIFTIIFLIFGIVGAFSGAYKQIKKDSSGKDD